MYLRLTLKAGVAVCAGAKIASIVVGKPELFKEWNEEMEYMSGRIKVNSQRLLISSDHFEQKALLRFLGAGLASGLHLGSKLREIAVASSCNLEDSCSSCVSRTRKPLTMG